MYFELVLCLVSPLSLSHSLPLNCRFLHIAYTYARVDCISCVGILCLTFPDIVIILLNLPVTNVVLILKYSTRH